MKVAVFSTKSYDREFLDAANAQQNHPHEWIYIRAALNRETVALAADYPGVCVFVHDELDAEVIRSLAAQGTQLIALRCAGFNNVDLNTAADHGIKVVRVPAYSPYAVAEHTVGLMMSLNRKFHRAYARVREGNFELKGLMGFDMYGKTVGVIGTGKIGRLVLQILKGFGCRLLAHDPYPHPEAEALATYVELPELFSQSDIITLHCPLMPETYHLIDKTALDQMKDGVMLINTSRGALIDTLAVIEAMKTERVGYLGLDVYEEEDDLFFRDLSGKVIQDDVFSRLLTLPNVIITGHQGFFTHNALQNIAETTVNNISQFEKQATLDNEVSVERIR